MTKQETAQLLALLNSAYPRFKVAGSAEALSIWHEMLEDLPGEVVAVAVKRMISTLEYPPTIADIRKAVASAAQDAQGKQKAGEAWRKVIKAISDYGYYRPDEALAAIGEDAWRAVEMIGGWANLCIGEEPESVLSAQFERRYDAMIEQQAHGIQIPASVNEDMKRLVAPLMERLALTE